MKDGKKLDSNDLSEVLIAISKIDYLTGSTFFKMDLKGTIDYPDPLNELIVIRNITSDPIFMEDHRDYIMDNYPTLYKKLDYSKVETILSNMPMERRNTINEPDKSSFDDWTSSKKSAEEPDESMKILDRRILGDWIISKKSAEEVKVIIGISGYDNHVLGVYELDPSTSLNSKFIRDSNNNRVRFSSYVSRLTPKVSISVLKDWSSRNPVLYPNVFEDTYKKEISSLLKPLKLDKYDGKRDIIVVKTFFKEENSK